MLSQKQAFEQRIILALFFGGRLDLVRNECFYPRLDGYKLFANNKPLLLKCLLRSYDGKLAQVF